MVKTGASAAAPKDCATKDKSCEIEATISKYLQFILGNFSGFLSTDLSDHMTTFIVHLIVFSPKAISF